MPPFYHQRNNYSCGPWHGARSPPQSLALTPTPSREKSEQRQIGVHSSCFPTPWARMILMARWSRFHPPSRWVPVHEVLPKGTVLKFSWISSFIHSSEVSCFSLHVSGVSGFWLTASPTPTPVSVTGPGQAGRKSHSSRSKSRSVS